MKTIKFYFLKYYKIISTLIFREIDTIGGMLALFFQSFVELIHLRNRSKSILYKETVQQIYYTGVKSVVLIVMVALLLGFLTTFYLQQFENLITSDITGLIFSIVIVREFGPLFTSIIVIARSSAFMSSEIATMVINEEMQAMESMGGNTLQLILLPRFIGIMVSMLFLNIIFDCVGIFGGVFANKLLNPSIDYVSFITNLFASFSFWDIFIIFLKSMVLGGIISVTSAYAGFKAGGSLNGIALATQKGGVMGFLWVFFLNGLITFLFYTYTL